LSATAEELSAQANQLQDLMAYFRINGTDATPSRAGAARGGDNSGGAGAGGNQRPRSRVGQTSARSWTGGESGSGAKQAIGVDESRFKRF